MGLSSSAESIENPLRITVYVKSPFPWTPVRGLDHLTQSLIWPPSRFGPTTNHKRAAEGRGLLLRPGNLPRCVLLVSLSLQRLFVATSVELDVVRCIDFCPLYVKHC